jgi:ribonuclease J
MLGVNVVIPDFTYLLENSHKIRGLFITHGHEDHIGAVPYLLDQLDIPVYANKLVQGFIGEKIKGSSFKGLAQRIRFNLLDPESGEVTVGPFKVSAFALNHSVPRSMGFAINTPEGTILHMADYKIDWTPVLDPPIDLGKIAMYGSKGVLCLLSDCLNVTSEGYSRSERTLNETFFDLFEYAEKRQVFITTISSNLSRMYQIITAALKHNRKVVLSGRSIEQSVDVARRLGLLKFDEAVFVKEKDAASIPQSDLVYIFGQIK